MTSTQVLEDVAEAAKIALSEGITAAWASDGYVDREGARDPLAIAEAAYAAVVEAVVSGKGEREINAATHGSLVASMFPSLPKTAEEWSAQDDPALAEKVYGEIRKQVGELLKPDRNGKVQKLVGLRRPGFVLCKTKIGVDHIDAFYVTDDTGCITEDFVKPLNASILSSHRKMGRNMAMIVDRRPEGAEKWERLYKDAAKSGLTAGHDPIKLAIEAARDNGDGNVDPVE